MHSKATPNSPFSAPFVILRTRDGSHPKPRKTPQFINWWKCIISALLLIACCSTNVNAQTYYQRTYASSQGSGSGGICLGCSVTNAPAAVDAAPAGLNTASTITVGVGVASFEYQDLIFANPIPANQGVILKIGTPASLLSVTLGTMTAQPMNGASTAVGTAANLSSALATLLTNNNQLEIYVPAPGGAGTYDRVRVQISGTVSVGSSLLVYAAYYNTPATSSLACDQPIDVIGGPKSLLDIASLVTLGTVTNPGYAIDGTSPNGDTTTAAVLSTLASVAAYTRLNVIFPGLAKTGDSVRIIFGSGGGLLGLSALQSLTFLTYNGTTVVDSINGGSSLLTLGLLSGPGSKQTATFASSGPFDHVEVRVGSIANVTNSLNVYDVRRFIPSPIVSAAVANQSTCLNTPATFSIQSPDATLNYTWYNGSGGIVQGPASTSTYSPPVNTAGTFNYSVTANRTLCTTGSQPTPLSLLVKAYTTAADLNFPDSAYSCMGDTVRITPYSTTLTKPVFKWWQDAAKTTPITNGLVVGGTTFLIDSTGKLTIIGLPAGTNNYFVSASDSTHCDNLANTLKQVTVITTSKAPVPTLGSSNVFASVNQPVTLLATPPGGGTVYWYSDTTQAPIGSGNTITVGPFATPGIYKYYASVRLSSSGACESYRVVDTITVSAPPNTTCNMPNSTVTGTTLGCILCSVTNPNNAIDTSLNVTYSTLNIPVGLLGGSVYQQVIFPTTGAATDSLRLTFGYNGSLATVGLLAGVEITVANGTTVIDRDTLSNLVTLNLLSSPSKFTVTIPTGAPYNTVQVKLTGVANLLSSINFYGVRAVAPNPTFTNSSTCVGSKDTITASGLGANTLKWYTDSTTTVIAGTGTTFVTPVLTTPGVITYYAQVTAADGCTNPDRIPVQVNVVNPPAAPVVPGTIVISTGQTASLTAAPVTGVTVNWYTDSTTATPVGTGSPLVVGPFSNPGTYTYWASASVNGSSCSSGRVPVTIVVTGPVVPPTACNVATSQNSGTTLGCILCSVQNPTFDIDSSSTNFTTLSIPVGLLGGSVYQQLIFPNTGNATDSIQVTLGTSGALANVGLLGGTVLTVYNGTTKVSADTLSNLLTLRLLSGNQQFVATIPTGGAYDRVEVRLTGVANLLNSINIYGARIIYPNPTINTANDTVCVNTKATLTVTPAPGTSVHWYADSTSTTILSSSNTYTTDTLKTPGTVTYWVAAYGGPQNCENPNRVPVQVVVKALGAPTDIVLADTTTACTTGNAVLAPTANPASGITNPTFSWYFDAAKTQPITNATVGGTTYAIDSTGKLTITGLAVGTYTYYVAIAGSNRCPNAAGNLKAAVVNVVTAPAPPVVAGAVVVATGQTASLTATPVPGATINWYADSTTTTVLGSGTPFVVGPFSNPGTYTYWAAVSIPGACSSARVPVVVTVTGPVVPPTACNVATSQVSGTTLGCILCSVQNPTFDIDSSTTNFTTLSIPVGLLGGSVYQQLIFPNTGSATDSIQVTLGTSAALANVGLLGGTVLTVYNGTTQVSADTLSNLLTLRLLSGNQQFIATIPTGGAYDRVEIRLTGVANLLNSINIYGARVIYPNPTINTTNDTVCVNTKATLTVTPSAGTGVHWYADSTSTTVLGSNPTYTTDTLKTPGTVTYWVAVYGGPQNCENPNRIPVQVVVKALGAPTDIVLADTTTACTTGNAVLAPTANPASGITNPTFSWYFDAAKTQPITNATVGGTTYAIDSTGKLTITGLAVGTYTYYVAIAGSNRCPNAAGNLKAAVVNIVTAPAPPVVAGAVVVATGQTASLTATPVPGATINWYADSTTTTVLGSGTPFVVGPFSNPGTYTYWAAVSIPGACSSARVPVVVTVTGPVVPPTACNVATSQVSGTTLGCILCSVQNPTFDIDSSTTNFTTLSIPVGLLGGSVYQQLIFPNTGSATDSIQVTLGTSAALANVGLLGGTVLTVYNGTTQVSADTLSNLLTLRLLSGNQQFIATIPTGGAYDRVEIRLTGVANLLNSINIYGARVIYPNPTINTTNDTVCVNTKATLTVTPSAGTGVHWYADSTSTTVLGSNPTYTTDTLKTPGTVTYWVAVYGGPQNCENPNRIPVQVVVKALGAPTDIVLADTTTACTTGNAVLAPTANPASGITNPTFSWYFDAAKTQPITNATVGGTTYAIDSTGKLTITGLAVGTYTYYVAIAGGNRCPNAAGNLKAAVVNIVTAPAPPVVAGAVVVATGQTASLTATPVPGATINWYADSTTTTVLGSGTPFVVGPFSNPGTYTYWAAVSIPGACSSARVPVVVTVTGPVVPPTACNVATSQVSGTTLGCILCSVQNPTFDIDSSTTNFTTLAMPVGLLGGSVYQQLIFPNAGSATDSIQVTLGTSTALADVSLLGGTVLTVYNGTTKVSADTLSNLLTLRLLSGNQQFIATIPTGGAYDRVEIRLTGVANLLNSINIYGARVIYPNPTINTTNDTVCVNTKATLTVTPSAGTGVHWYADSTSTTVLGSNPTYTTDTLKTPGTVTYWVAVYGGPQNCENPNRIPVQVVVKALGAPTDIVLADTTTACTTGNAVLAPTANPASGITNPTFSWYFDAAKTQPITNATVGGTTYAIDSTGKLTITGLAVGTYTYYVAIAGSNRCPNAAGNLKAAVVNIVTAPAPPVVAGAVVVATGQTASLTATPVPGATINWYADSTTTTVLGSGTPFVVGPFSNPGTYTYWAGVSIPGACSSARVPVVVTVTGPVVPPTACNVATSQTSGTTLGCILCSVQNPTFDIDSSTTNFTTLAMPVGLLGGSVYQELIFPNTGSATDSIQVTLGTSTALADVSLLGGTVLTVYNGTTKVSADTLSNLLTLRLLSGNQQFIATIPTGAAYDRVEIRLTGVANLLNSINIYGARIIYPNPTINTPHDTVCVNTKATLTVTPSAGTGVHWYADSTSTTVLGSNPTYTTDTLKTPGIVTYWVAVYGGPQNCENPNRIPVQVVVTPLGTPADINLADTTIACANGNAVLAPTANPASGITNPTFSWYFDAAKTQPITNATVGGVTYVIDSTGKLTITGLAVGTYTYYVAIAGSNRCGNAPGNLKSAVVDVVTTPAPPVVAGAVVIATGQTASLTATPVPGATINWYADSTTTTVLGSGTPFVVGPFNSPGTFTYWAAVVVPGGCSSARVPVVVTVTGPVVPPTACNVATSQTSGTTLGCILCSVQNPTFDIDSSTTNFTTLAMPVGLLGGSVYQELIFPSTGNATDSIQVTLGTSTALADVSLLGGTVLTVYNGTTKVSADTLSNLLTLRLLSGNQQFIATIPTGAAYDRVEIRLTGVANLLNSINIYGARIIYPNPTINTPHDTVCANTRATLTVTPATGTGVHWYADSTSTTVLSSSNTYTTDTLKTPGIVTYWLAVYGGPQNCENPNRIPVQVVVTPLGTPADINLADTTIACANGNAVLAPTANPASGITNPTFSWYFDAAKTQPITNATVGGVTYVIDSTGKLTISGLAVGTYTYYVAIAGSNRCGNAPGNLKSAVVDVVTTPAPPVVAGAVVVATGQTASLTATPVPGATINWYADSTTTTVLGSGTPFVVGPFNSPGIFTYWAAVVVPGGCSSARVPVVVTVTGPVVPPTACNMATSQVSGTTLGCILCSVQNPTFDIDSSTTNFTTLAMPVGLLGGSVYQQLIFPSTGNATDSIRVTLGSSVNLVDASLLGGTVLTVYNGTTQVSADTLSHLLTLELLGGGSQIIATIPTGAPYDRVQVTLTGVANLLNSINIYGARIIYPNPTVNTPHDTICANTAATLTVTPATGTGVHWYADSTSTTVLSSSNTYTTDTLRTPGIVTYWLAVYGGPQNCENPNRIPVPVVVLANPTPIADTSNPSTVCISNLPVTLKVVAQPGVTYTWYDSTGNVLVANSNAYTTSNTLAVGPHTFFVEGTTANGCNNGNAKTPITITVTNGSLPSDITIDSVRNGCVGDTIRLVPTSTTVPNPVFMWYADQQKTMPITNGVNPATGVLTLTNLAVGSYTYYVSVSNNGNCANAPGNLKPVTVNITAIPPAPVADSSNPTSVCQSNLPATLKVIAQPGITYTWYDSVGNVLPAANNVYTTPNTLPVGTYTYYVKANNANGCANDTARTPITLTVFKNAVAADIIIDSVQTGCTSDTIRLTPTSTTVPNPVFMWYADQQKTMPITNGVNPATGVLTLTNLTVGTHIYYVSVSNNSICANQAGDLKQVTVNIVAVPGAPVADSSNPTSVCQSNLPATLKVIAQPGITYTWYDSVGNVLPAANNVYTTPNTLPVGTYTYYVKANNANGCANDTARTPITLTVFKNAVAADIIIDSVQTGCTSDTIRLTPTSTTVPNPVFMWYADQQKTMPITNGVNPATGVLTLTNLTVGTHIYYVSVSNNGICANQAGDLKQVTVNIVAVPGAPVADSSNPTSVCQSNLPATLKVIAQPGITYTWYDSVGNVLPAANNVYTTPNTLPVGTYTYYVKANNANGCANDTARTPITLTVFKNAVAADIIIDSVQTGCTSDTIRLTPTSTTVPNPVFMWYADQQKTMPITNGVNPATGVLTLTNLTVGTHIYYVSVSNNGICANQAGDLKQVTVNIVAVPGAPVADSSNPTSVCQSNLPATLKVIAQPGITYTWYDSVGNVLPAANNVYTTPNTLPVGTYTYYVKANNANGCANDTARTPITLTVFKNAVAADIIIDSVQTGCTSDTIRLTPRSTTIANPVFLWYADQQKTMPITNGVNPATGVLTLTNLTVGTHVYYVSVSSNGNCANQAGDLKQVTVNIVAVPGAPVADSSNPTSVCQSNLPATLKVIAQPGITYTWYDSVGNVLPAANNVYTTPNTLPVGIYTYYVKANNANGCANDTARTPITLTVFKNAVAADIIIDSVQTGCTSDTIRLTPRSTTIANPVFMWYADQQKTMPITNGVNPATGVLTLTNLTVGTHVYYVSVSSNGNCANQAGDLKQVTVNIVAVPGAPVADSSNPTSVCQSNLPATLKVIAQPGVTYTWYDASGNILTAANNVYTTPNTLAVGTYTYYVKANNVNGCASDTARTPITLTVFKNAVAADINIDSVQNVCLGDTVRLVPTSTTITNPVFMWYADQQKTMPITNGVNPATGVLTLTNLTVGTHVYYVSVSSNGNCANQAGDLKQVTVNIVAVPGAPVADSSNPTSVCQSNLPATLKVIAQPGVTYTWYDASGNILTAANNVYTTPNTLAVGTYTYYVKANNVNGCASDTARTPITLTVFKNAVAADINIDSVQNVCLGDTVRLVPTSTTITNPVFLWYADQQKTTPITNGVNPATGVLTLTNLSTGTYTYYVSVSSNGNCANLAGDLKQVTVNVGRKATAADIQVTGNTTTCANTTVTLTASSTTVTNPVFRWYRDAALTQFIRSTSTFVTDTLTTTTTYYVTVQGVNACENAPGAAQSVTVTVTSALPAPTVSGAAICAGQTALVQVTNPDATVTYTWYNNQTRSVLLATADSFRTGPLTADTTLYVQASKAGCISQLVPAVITVNSVASPVVDANQPVCAGSSGTLVIKAPVNGVVYRWYNVPTGGTALNTDAGTSFITGPLNTSTIFYVEATGTSGCTGASGRVPVTAVITPAPGAPTLVTNNQTICAGGSVTFTIANPDPSVTYHWFTAAVNGTELTPTTPTTLTVNNVIATTTYYVSAVNAAGCSNAGGRTTATVNVNPAPTAPVVTIPNQVVCLNNSATFQVSNPDPALTYVWYGATNNDSLTTGTSFTTPVLTANMNYYVVAKNNTGCSSQSNTAVTVTVTNSIATPTVGANQTLCLGQTLTLNVINPVAGIVYHWYTTATGGTPVATGATVTFNGVIANTAYYVDASATAGNCTSSTRAMISVTVNSIPAAPAAANPGVTTCLNTTATLAVLNADPTLTYNWYTVQSGGTPVATGASVNVGPITTNTNYYVEDVNASGCPSAQRTLVTVTASTAPAAPQVSGNGQSQCPGSSYILTATSTTPGASFAWYTTATGGTPISQTSIFTTPAISQNTTYYVEASINGGCVSATRTAVPITVLAPLPAPVVTVTNKTATSITFTWTAIPGATGYVVSVGDSTHFVAPSTGATGTSHTVTNLQPNQNVTIYVRAIGVGTCQNSPITAVTDKTTNPNGNNCYVPNLFSPNGDGINDIEYVYGTAIAQLEFRIYNHWGQLVFESKDQRQGWDGTMNGVKQPVGVYVYILKATMQDGTVVTKKGNVTLMR